MVIINNEIIPFLNNEPFTINIKSLAVIATKEAIFLPANRAAIAAKEAILSPTIMTSCLAFFVAEAMKVQWGLCLFLPITK